MYKNLSYKIVKFLLFFQALVLLAAGWGFFCQAADSIEVGQIEAESESQSSRIAPGEFLPVSVKLVNFGSLNRVDVIVDYKILNESNEEIYSENETVAVETTASFIKRIQIPYTAGPGNYTLVSVLTYPYQEQPAVSQFPFMIEKKIGGFFVSDLILYSIVALLAILVIFIFIYFFTGYGQKRKIVLHDYSDKPKDKIIYYQILSDIISEMRLRIGNDALEIAKDIPDLQINEKTGLIIDIKNDSAKIIALLISRYEKIAGQHVSFSLRKESRK